jgi:sarcosine oxidase subunit alpha
MPGLAQQPTALAPASALWRIRALGRIVSAIGAIERPLAFAGNDRPGVMLASAVRDFLVNWAVTPGDRVVVVANNDDAYRTALLLHRAGLVVPVILDARTSPDGELVRRARDAGIPVAPGRGVAKVKGRSRITGVAVCAVAGEGTVLEEVACDAVAMSGGWSPSVHLWSHCGGKLEWDEARAMFLPDPRHPPLNHDGRPLVIPAAPPWGTMRTSARGLRPSPPRARFRRRRGIPPSPAARADEGPCPVWVMPQGAPTRSSARCGSTSRTT